MFFQVGSYHLGFLAKEKLGAGTGPKDVTRTLAEHMVVVRKPVASVYNNVMGLFPTPLFDVTWLATIEGQLITLQNGDQLAILNTAPNDVPLAWWFNLEDGGSLVMGAGGKEPYAALEDLVINGSAEIVTGYDLNQGVWEVNLIQKEMTPGG
jgi:hypothetical protein